MVQTIRIIGSGRVGSAVAARLRERGFELSEDEADLVLLCVPDRAIPEVAATVPEGPWIGHTSGATPLSALDPHERRFGLHPLQSFTRARGPEQLDGAYAAVTGESDEAREVGSWLARQLGLEPFALDDSERALYHAGAVVAASYLVTLHQAAADLVQAAGAPPEALLPSDAARDRERLRADRAGRARRLGDGRGAPGGDQGAAARAGAALSGAGGRHRGAGRRDEDRPNDRRANGTGPTRDGPVGSRSDDGRVPRRAPGAVRGRARGERRRRREPVRQSGAVRRERGPRPLPARRGARREARRGGGRRRPVRSVRCGDVPGRLRDLGRRRRARRSASRASSGPTTSAAWRRSA